MPPIQIGRRRASNQSQPNFGRQPTAQEKLIATANRFGNKGLKHMQGSTYVIYDHLPLPEGGVSSGTELRFFENAANRTFPFTNLMEGRLPVGEGMVLERLWLNILTVETATGNIVNVQTFSEFGLPGTYKLDFQFQNANQIVIKPTPLVKQKSQFNWKARHSANEVVHLDTDITIQPLIDFALPVRLPALATPTSSTLDFFIGCYVEGAGAIMNPRSNY